MKPIQQEYESIHWNGKREKFKAEHGGELSRLQKALWLREKLVKSLGLASPLDKEQRAALKTERMQLEAEREALLPKLEEVKAELAELNRIRYWTRKVIPDALPHVSDGRVLVEDAVETAANRKELEQIDLFEVDHPIVGGAFFSASFITCTNSFPGDLRKIHSSLILTPSLKPRIINEKNLYRAGCLKPFK